MLKRLLFVLVPALGCVPLLTAGIIYSNIGAGFPGDSPGSSYNFAGPNGFEGTTFITTGGGILATISLSVGGNTSPVTGGLYANSAGEPGTLLESWTFSQPLNPTVAPPVTTLTSLLHPSLSAGTQYWFVLSMPSTGQSEGWFENDQGATGGTWTGTSINGLSQAFASSPADAIRLDSTPEPTTGLLFALGSLVLLTRLKGLRLKVPSKENSQ